MRLRSVHVLLPSATPATGTWGGLLITTYSAVLAECIGQGRLAIIIPTAGRKTYPWQTGYITPRILQASYHSLNITGLIDEERAKASDHRTASYRTGTVVRV